MRLLYKYVPLQTEEHFSRIARILNGWIYFSSPTRFNDPFELSPVVRAPSNETIAAVLDHIQATQAGASKSAQKKIIADVQSKIRQRAPNAISAEWVSSLGVLCLTTDPKDLLMWAHYASSHTGVCIGFDSSYKPFAEAKPVRYIADRPEIPSLDPEQLGPEVAETVLLRKSPHWRYEQEWRTVRRPIRDDEKSFYRQGIGDGTVNADDVAQLLASEGGSGQYEFDPDAIKRVILGARSSDSHRQGIRALIESRRTVKLLRSEIDKKYFVLNLLAADA